MSAKLLTRYLIVLGTMSAAAVRADEVSLSRLVAEVDSTAAIRGIDFAPVERFCGDADGCLIVFLIHSDEVAATWTARLFVNVGEANRWFSSDTPGYFVDSDVNVDEVASLERVPNKCVMTDGDLESEGDDGSQGFVVEMEGGPENPATCVVTISD